jgi:hypothetical protein
MNLPEIAFHLALYAVFLPAAAFGMGFVQSRLRKHMEEVEELRMRLAEAEREITRGRGLTAALAERLLAHEKAGKSESSWNPMEYEINVRRRVEMETSTSAASMELRELTQDVEPDPNPRAWESRGNARSYR